MYYSQIKTQGEGIKFDPMMLAQTTRQRIVTEEIIHKVVDEISFGLISPKDLRKQSVVEIQTPDRAILRFAKGVWACRGS